jgi:hypothetical protein
VLDAADAAVLQHRWRAFEHLHRLDLAGNALDDAATRGLRERGPGVVVGDQRVRVDGETHFRPPPVGFLDTWTRRGA